MNVKMIKIERKLDDFFRVDKAYLQYEKFNGDYSETVFRFNLDRREAAAVLIYLEDKDRLLLIRQFRYADYTKGLGGWIDEIVAGVMEEGETPLQCARRETIEETGYEIDRFEHIASAYSSPGITTEFMHLYLGLAHNSDLKHRGGGLDEEHEDIQLLEISREEAMKRLRNKRIRDAKTILALQYFLLNHPSSAK